MSDTKQRGSIVAYKAALRKQIRKKAAEPEINYLNITPMLDIMTIILVFLLKSMGESTSSISQSDDLKLPASTVPSDPAQDGVMVTISKTQILVGNEKVLTLPTRESLAQTGVGARYKSRGAQNLYIDPLGQMLKQARQIDKAVRIQKGLDPSTSSAIIVADETTPFRLLAEVMKTLGEEEFGKYQLMVVQSKAN